jgi:hypothetical protein
VPPHGKLSQVHGGLAGLLSITVLSQSGRKISDRRVPSARAGALPRSNGPVVAASRLMPSSNTRVDSTVVPESRPRVSGAPRRTRTIGKALLIGLACALLGYLGGTLHGWLRARGPEREHAAVVARLQRKVDELTVQVREERAARVELVRALDLYEAYRSASQALVALDARNFGIAETQLRESEGRVSALIAGMPRLGALQRTMAGTSIAVAGDLAEQRATLADILAQLDSEVTVARGALPSPP